MFATKDCDMIVPTGVSRIIKEVPYIAEYNNFLSKKQCRAIIEHIPNLKFTQGTVRLEGKRQINLDFRKAFTHKISDTDPQCLAMWPERIAQWLSLPSPQWIENSLLVHYPSGGEFKTHTDVVTTTDAAGRVTHRVGTVIVYLNANFEGGLTVFPTLRAAVEPSVGKALFFTYNYDDQQTNSQTIHYGQNVVGDKYVLIFFIRDSEYSDELRALSVY